MPLEGRVRLRSKIRNRYIYRQFIASLAFNSPGKISAAKHLKLLHSCICVYAPPPTFYVYTVRTCVHFQSAPFPQRHYICILVYTFARTHPIHIRQNTTIHGGMQNITCYSRQCGHYKRPRGPSTGERSRVTQGDRQECYRSAVRGPGAFSQRRKRQCEENGIIKRDWRVGI